MREVNTGAVAHAVAALCEGTNYCLGEDVQAALDRALAREDSPLGRDVLRQLQENARIARRGVYPICQDTGYAVVYAEVGQEVHLVGKPLAEAVDAGVRHGYAGGFLRKSLLRDPVARTPNTGDNTPAALHVELVPGDQVKLTVMAKGGGCENMSGLRMLKPADGAEGIVAFVVETVRQAGSNPCPPVIVGVGIGGTFDGCAALAKRALLRPVGQPHPDPGIAALESQILEAVNALGIGPEGFGGRTTALAVHVETAPCHIASLPVAVNLDCHAHRVLSVTL